jgi:tRNA dimethylallyltransferase
MLAEGVLDEVSALLAMNLDPALPAMRAQGVPELASYLRGQATLDAAIARAELLSGQLTKRQATWFRHRIFADPARVHTIHARIAGLKQLSESQMGILLNFIHGRG